MDGDKCWGGARPRAGRPKASSRKEAICVTMPKELLAAVDRLASARGRGRSEALAFALANVDFDALVEVAGSPEPRGREDSRGEPHEGKEDA